MDVSRVGFEGFLSNYWRIILGKRNCLIFYSIEYVLVKVVVVCLMVVRFFYSFLNFRRNENFFFSNY